MRVNVATNMDSGTILPLDKPSSPPNLNLPPVNYRAKIFLASLYIFHLSGKASFLKSKGSPPTAILFLKKIRTAVGKSKPTNPTPDWKGPPKAGCDSNGAQAEPWKAGKKWQDVELAKG